jgi:GNAT superfamily N-acetyltransferase
MNTAIISSSVLRPWTGLEGEGGIVMNLPDEWAIRRAAATDAAAIAAVLADCWPDDTPDVPRIARLSVTEHRATLVAERAGQLAACIDAFMTIAPDGTTRWEVDLLAVAGPARRKGLGTQLVAQVTRVAPAQAALARALVRVGNTPAERAFEHAGFSPGGAQMLFIAPAQEEAPPTLPGGMTQVDTLTYSGFWIEPGLSVAEFNAAWQVGLGDERGLVGAVVDVGSEAEAVCTRDGSPARGPFRWWMRRLDHWLAQRRGKVVATADDE